MSEQTTKAQTEHDPAARELDKARHAESVALHAFEAYPASVVHLRNLRHAVTVTKIALIYKKRGLEAAVLRACQHRNSGGKWSTDPWTRALAETEAGAAEAWLIAHVDVLNALLPTLDDDARRDVVSALIGV
jgi:hypothetical protein